MEGNFKVSPQEIQIIADEFGDRGNRIVVLMNEILGVVEGIGSCWEGDVALIYINKFKGLQQDINSMNKMIQNHVQDLSEMAKNYTKIEKQSQELQVELFGDVIK